MADELDQLVAGMKSEQGPPPLTGGDDLDALVASMKAQKPPEPATVERPLPGTEAFDGKLPGMPKPPIPFAMKSDAQQDQEVNQAIADYPPTGRGASFAPLLKNIGGDAVPGTPTPQDLEQLALGLGISGLGEAAAGATSPVARKALAALSKSAAVAFSYQQGKSGLEAWRRSASAFEKGDYENAIGELARGGMELGLAAVGVKEGRGLVAADLAKPKLAAEPIPEGPTVDVNPAPAALIGERQAPAEPTPATEPEPVKPAPATEADPLGELVAEARAEQGTKAPTVRLGDTFQTDAGEYKVTGTPGGFVIYKGPDGKPGTRAIDSFHNMLISQGWKPQPAPTPATTTPQHIPSHVTENVLQSANGTVESEGNVGTGGGEATGISTQGRGLPDNGSIPVAGQATHHIEGGIGIGAQGGLQGEGWSDSSGARHPPQMPQGALPQLGAPGANAGVGARAPAQPAQNPLQEGPSVQLPGEAGLERVQNLQGRMETGQAGRDEISQTKGNETKTDQSAHRADSSAVTEQVSESQPEATQTAPEAGRIQAKTPEIEGQPNVAETPQSAPVRAEPGWVGNVSPSELSVDPVRFQYKQDVGQKGVTDKLKGLQTYNPEQGGILSVWKDPADGKTYVVNGHHRQELAERTGAPQVAVRYLAARNAQEARLKGAIINISEDQGTSIDAAKVFRDSGQTPEGLAKNGLSLKGRIASEGLALANLDPHLFSLVTSGDLPASRGAVIGAGLPEHADQRALYDLIQARDKSGKRLTNDQIAEMVRLATAPPEEGGAPRTTDTQESLFGPQEVTRSLIPEKAEVSDYVRKQLAQEKRLFATVGKESAAAKLGEAGNVIRASENQGIADQAGQALAIYDKLSARSGPVADALNSAASALAEGKNAAEAKSRAYQTIRASLIGEARKLAGVPQGNGGRVEGLGSEGPLQTGAGERNPSAAELEGQPPLSSRIAGPRWTPTSTPGRLLDESVAKPAHIGPDRVPGLYVNRQAMVLLNALAEGSDDGQWVMGMLFPWPLATRVMRSLEATLPNVTGLRAGATRNLIRAIQAVQGQQGRPTPFPVIQNGPEMSASDIEEATAEELDHLAQIEPAFGLYRLHLGAEQSAFLANPLAQKAAQALYKNYGELYPPALALEIGVRLMRPGRYRELGLTAQEAEDLAVDYVQALKREHGNQMAKVINRVYNAFGGQLRGRNQQGEAALQFGRAPRGAEPQATGSPAERGSNPRGVATPAGTPRQGSLFSRKVGPDWYYSQLERAIEDKMPERASIGQILGIIRNPQNGVKPDEIKWTGFEDWLAKHPTTTKAEALEYLRENAVKVKEKRLGPDPQLDARIDAAEAKLNAAKEKYLTTGSEIEKVIRAAGLEKVFTGREVTGPVNRPDLFGEVARYAYGTIHGYPQWANHELFPAIKAAVPKELFDRYELDVRAKLAAQDERHQLTSERSSQAQPKFASYATPGGENYSELLMTLPDRRQQIIEEQRRIDEETRGNGGILTDERRAQWTALENERQRLLESDYKSPHWDEPNVLAHARFDTRVSPDGKKTLCVQEIQSDWHQQGKKQGYKKNVATPQGSKLITDGDGRILAATDDAAEAKRLSEQFEAQLNDPGVGWVDRDSRDGERAIDRTRGESGVPAAPFAKTWHQFAFRRMLRWAAEHGYDRVAWTTGEQQAERYDLSKHLSEIAYEPILSEDDKPTGLYEFYAKDKNGREVIHEDDINLQRIEDLVGKEMAEKIQREEGEKGLHGPYRDWRVFSGLSLKVGGEGMKGFYDKILPEYANKYGKKWGAKVGTTDIQTTTGKPDGYKIAILVPGVSADGKSIWRWEGSRENELSPAFDSEEKAIANRPPGQWFYVSNDGHHAIPGLNKTESAPAHSIDITPSMRESVMQGQPLFQKGEPERQESLFGEAYDPEAQRVAEKQAQEKLTGDQLTAQFKSGLPMKPAKLKPATTHELFGEEKPEQEALFQKREPSAARRLLSEEAGQLDITKLHQAILAHLSSGKLPGVFDEFKQAVAARRTAVAALEAAKDEPTDKQFGEKFRTFYTGERDVRIAETNQLRDLLKAILPSQLDQEALSLMRDFKNRPGELEQFANGTHPAYGTLPPGERDGAVRRVQSLAPVIDRALNPSEEMQRVDQLLTGYFAEHLDEGRRLGFLDSKISNEDYITHILQPRDAPEGPQAFGGSGSGYPKVGSRYFQQAKQRFYPTLLHAVANGIRPRTLNALDALGVYGDRFGKTAATHMLISMLKGAGMGKWGTSSQQSDGKIPDTWVELAPERRLFRNEVPFLTSEGEAAVAHQMFFVPKYVRDALRPITDENYMSRVPFFMSARAYQAYLKSVELGMSFFHIKALSVTGLGNEGPAGLLATWRSDMDTNEFRDAEKALIRAGGTTTILGRTVEAYRGLSPGSIPTRLDLLRKLPGLKQADAVARAVSEYTFDVIQRKLKVTDFALKDAAWRGKNPNATEQERLEAQRQIAKELNAAYGGLQWENLGVHRVTLELSRAILLAPDWTFSNVLNLGYSFEGGPAGNAARMFWIRSAILGLALTAGMSILLTGKASKHPTEVHLGKNKKGEDIYQNMFFVGAPGDFVTTINNIHDYGATLGLAHTIAGKLGPLGRATEHQLANTDDFGRPLINRYPKKGETPAQHALRGSLAGGKQLAKDIVPVPFSFSTIGQMLLDKNREYTPAEYGAAAINGRPPRVEHEGAQHRAGKLPHFGEGGVVNHPTKALVAEKGEPEAIVDLGKHPDIVRGSSDIPLSPEGEAASQKLAERFAAKGGVQRIRASSLTRTVQTAEPISRETGAPIVEKTKGLHPWSYGNLEGKPRKLVQPLIETYVLKKPDLAIPGEGPLSTEPGESFNSFKRRLLNFVKDGLADLKHDPEMIEVWVSHGSGLKIICSWIKRGAAPSLEVDRNHFVKASDEPGTVQRLYLHDGKASIEKFSLKGDAPLPKGSIFLVSHEATDWNGKSKQGGVKIVSKPTVIMLGAHQPQAVVPLRPAA